MNRYLYPVDLTDPTEPGGTVLACFPDVPEAITDGEDRAEAMLMAADALATALEGYLEAGRPLPARSPTRGRPVVAVPGILAAKAALHEAMAEQDLTQVALARNMRVDPAEVRRCLNPRYGGTKLARLEAALTAMGRTLVVEIRAA